MKPTIAIAGPGKVGCALGRRLAAAGYPLTGLYARDPDKGRSAATFIGLDPANLTQNLAELAGTRVIILALPDDRLQEFSTRLQAEAALGPETTLIHCSGLHPAAILAPGAQVGRLSLHPLLPFANAATAAARLDGCPFALEGDEEHLPLGKELISALGGKPFLLPSTAKPLYHAAASMASNFLVSLTERACALLVECGLTESDALDLIAPLQQATLENCHRFGPAQALTGPIVRGDAGTLVRHLEALAEQAPDQLELYQTLATQTLRLALDSKRLAPDKGEEISKVLFSVDE